MLCGAVIIIIIIIILHYHERLRCQRIFSASGFIGLAEPSLDRLFYVKISVEVNCCKAMGKDLYCRELQSTGGGGGVLCVCYVFLVEDG